jgi:signal transduction histidine kinase/CheY-like chemotaxis protein
MTENKNYELSSTLNRNGFGSDSHHDNTERQQEEMEKAIITEIGRVIGSTLNIDEVYERFAAEAGNLIDFDRLAVNLHFIDENKVQIAYVIGEDVAGRRQGDCFPFTGSLSEIIVRTRSGIFLHPASIEEMHVRFPNHVASILAGMPSLMGVPLISKGEVIGSLHFRSKKINAYTEKDILLAERIGAQIAGAVANAQLFNELIKTEKSLRQSEKQRKEAQRVARLGHWIWHIKPNKLEWSEEMYSIFGIDMKHFTGNLSRVLEQAIHPDDRPIFEQANLAVIREKKLVPAEYRVVWPDKTVHWVWTEAGELNLDQAGDPGILTGIALDITERKRMEENRLMLEERLHRAEKMEALGTLAGGVAHDLNNVLGVVIGYSELLTMKIPEGDPTRAYADKILKSTEKAASIIQDLLTLARRGVVVSDVLHLNEVVSGFMKTPLFDSLKVYHPQVEFITDFDEELLNIKGSSIHLEKTVMNLISNAAESIAGRGEVTIRTENRYLDSAVRTYDTVRKGEYAVFSVSDSGRGIPAADLEKIFEPFYTKKAMGRSGTGLGLAIVWGTVKDHNGYIDVQSIEGVGTTFTLYFPVTREKRVEDAEKIPVETYMGHGESLLVVDDVAEQREMAATILRGLGYQVWMAKSGEEAVAYLKDHETDLLVLDMIMEPGIDGLETYRQALQIRPTQKAVIVSGFSETDRVKKALELGAGVYVRKPYIREKIGVAVRDELLKVFSNTP